MRDKKLLDKFITLERHHHGWMVRYPADNWNKWNFDSYREKYFESYIGGPRAYDDARRFKSEVRESLLAN